MSDILFTEASFSSAVSSIFASVRSASACAEFFNKLYVSSFIVPLVWSTLSSSIMASFAATAGVETITPVTIRAASEAAGIHFRFIINSLLLNEMKRIHLDVYY